MPPHAKPEARAEHDHRDPRADAGRHHMPHGAPMAARKANQGAFKARRVPRMDPVVNWGRRAAHPKQS